MNHFICLLVVASCLATVYSPAVADVVITEIMFNPLSGLDQDEFIELFNTRFEAVPLDGWRLNGVDLEFPPGTTIAPSARLVVARDAARFQSLYGFAPAAVYGGKLDNSGERLQLQDASSHVMDEVDYDDSAPWPATPDGVGPSLELIDPARDNNDPRNWHACTAGAGHTAGQPNSVAATSLPPWISAVWHTPNVEPSQPIDIIAQVQDATTVTVEYRIMFSTLQSTPMLDDGQHGDGSAADGVYGCSLAGHPASTLVRYRIVATGPTGAMRYPRDDDGAGFVGTVVQDASVQSALTRIQWFVDPADYADANSHSTNDDTEPAVLFHGGRLYDNCQFRARGSGSARRYPKKHWRFYMPAGHDLVAPELHPLAIDQFNLQGHHTDKSYLRTQLSFESFAEAGVPASLARMVRVEQNGAYFGLYTFVESMDDDFLQRNGWDADGAWYKCYRDARAQSLASLPSNYQKKSREFEGFEDLHALLENINTLSGEALRNYLYDHLDLPQLLNYLAVTCVIHNNDHVAKNYWLYRDTPGSGRWSMQPYDQDLTFGRNYVTNGGGVLSDIIWADDDVIPDASTNASPSHPLFGDAAHQKIDLLWNRLIHHLYADPLIREMYYRRLRSVCDLLLSPGRFEARIDQLVADLSPEAVLDRARWPQYGQQQSLAQSIHILKYDYLAARRVHLLSTHRTANAIPEAQTPNPAIIISEIMYNPPGGEADEFVELYNPGAESVDLSGWSVDGISAEIPHGTVLLGGRFLVLAADDLRFRTTYGSGQFVPLQFDGALDGGGENIVLRNAQLIEVDAVRYDDDAPWPTAADGAGYSLELIDPSQDNNRAANWAASTAIGGTPGRANGAAGHLPPLPPLWINEVLPLNASVNVDEQGEFASWVEIYNASDQTAALGGMTLSNDYNAPARWTIPAGTNIPPHGWLLFWCDGETSEGPRHTNFTLSAAGGSIALFTPTGMVVDYLNYDPLPADQSYGKAPDGSALRQTFAVPTPQSPNLPPAPPIVLNEYNAVDGDRFLAANGTDTWFGRVQGNGGDWFELVVIQDQLDARGWQLVISDDTGGSGQDIEILTLSNDAIWSGLRSGTIITLAEDAPADVSYDPPNGDWWIHVQTRTGGSGAYVTPTNIKVSNNKWQLTIRNVNGVAVAGPFGEGIRPVSGVGGDEIGRLAEDPSPQTLPWSDYRDGTRSTFGSANIRTDGTSVQSFSALRAVCDPRLDVDGSGVVDGTDISRFAQWLVGSEGAPTEYRAADMNCDDTVDGQDVQRFVDRWLGP